MLSDIQEFQRLDKYARFIPELGRRETWPETTKRVISYFRDYKLFELPDGIWVELEEGLLSFSAFPSMRVIQMAGPSLERCEVGAFNCAAVALDSVNSFAELLYVLMQGTGCSFSVESEFISQLPEVGPIIPMDEPAGQFVIPDDTEGWCDAFKAGMLSWYNGIEIEFDYSKIRPAGSRLVTKGGYASGPEPLRELMAFTREIMRGAEGRQLDSVECHRIACKIADIVQVGGVRRAATLSHSDLTDERMRVIKNGKFWEIMPELGQANNSAVYEGPLDEELFDIEWENLRTSGTGERGIIRRDSILPARRPPLKSKMNNPCGEVDFDPFSFCNLSIAAIRPSDSKADVYRKVRLATIWGTLQSALTKYRYLSRKWKANVERERLLGVDIPGAFENRLFDRPGYVRKLRDSVIEINREFAAILGINPSLATTVVKPGGNSGVFLGVGHPVNGWVAQYMIRRVRVGTMTPMYRFLGDQGVPNELENERTAVFDFLVKAPQGARISTKMTALKQLERWLMLKENWTEHNPSVTIYVGEDEWTEVRDWVKAHWEKIGGLSFFPKTDHVYRLAPIEPVSRVEYEKRIASFPKIDWSLYYEYETFDSTTLGGDFACAGGACSV